MKTSSNYSQENRPFNMALMFLFRLDTRLDERDRSSNNGNLLGWYRELRTIYRNVHFKIIQKGQEEKEAELEKKFEKVHNLITSSNIRTNSTQLDLQVSAHSITQTENELHELDLMLNDLLFQYGLIFPNKDKRKLEEELEDDFKGD